MLIMLDFDDTVTENRYPSVGPFIPSAIEVIKKLQNANHLICLNTLRCESKDESLNLAKESLKNEGINLDAVTNNKILPDDWDWSEILRKQVMFIDDIAKNIPLRRCNNRIVVDWGALDRQFKENNIY